MTASKEQLERMEKFAHLFNNVAPIAQSFGMSLKYDDKLRAVFTQPYNPNFDHALKGIHGGVFATMLDNAGWFTAAIHYDCWIATVEFETRLLEHVQAETLIATGDIVRLGKRMAVTTMKIETEAGRLVATGSGTFTPIEKVPVEVS